MILADTSVLVANAAAAEQGALAVSVVSLGELQVGVRRAVDEQLKTHRMSRLAGIIENASIMPVDREVADAYATLRATVGGQPTNNLWIAATAIAHGLTLVTGDRAQAELPGVRARFIALSPSPDTR